MNQSMTRDTPGDRERAHARTRQRRRSIRHGIPGRPIRPRSCAERGIRRFEPLDLILAESRSSAATASSMWCSFVAPTICAVTALAEDLGQRDLSHRNNTRTRDLGHGVHDRLVRHIVLLVQRLAELVGTRSRTGSGFAPRAGDLAMRERAPGEPAHAGVD